MNDTVELPPFKGMEGNVEIRKTQVFWE